MENILRKSLQQLKNTLEMQVKGNTTAIIENQVDAPSLTEAELEEIKENQKKVDAFENNPDKLHASAVEIERGLKEKCGSEKEKPYRDQYRGLKGRFENPNEHKFRLSFFTEEGLFYLFIYFYI